MSSFSLGVWRFSWESESENVLIPLATGPWIFDRVFLNVLFIRGVVHPKTRTNRRARCCLRQSVDVRFFGNKSRPAQTDSKVSPCSSVQIGAKKTKGLCLWSMWVSSHGDQANNHNLAHARYFLSANMKWSMLLNGSRDCPCSWFDTWNFYDDSREYTYTVYIYIYGSCTQTGCR